MTEDTITKILKLSSGEEIICEIANGAEDMVSVKKPLRLLSYPKQTANGVEESISLTRWIHFAESDVYEVSNAQVIAIADASLGLKKFYEYCLYKMERFEDENEIQTPERIASKVVEDSDHLEFEDEDEDDLSDLEEWEPDIKTYH